MTGMETKTCFGCNQPTSNYKYEAETMRYYGEECLSHMAEHKLSPMEYNKCHGCGVAEIQCQGDLKWWEVKEMGGVKKLCFPCYQRTAEFKEYEQKEAEKKLKAEQEAKQATEKLREEYKKKHGKYPENNDPSQWTEQEKKESQEQVKKELESEKKKEKPKSKAQIKREIKEQKQNEARCLFCNIGFGWNIKDLEGKINQEATEKTPQGFLFCANCLTGGELPNDQDLKMIRKSWADGGMILVNYKKFPRPENLLLKYVEEGLKLGNLNVYTEEKKVYMEASHGGITIELNVYLKNQIK